MAINFKRSKKTGVAPGTLVHIGEERTAKVTINVFDYDEDNFREFELENIADCEEFRKSKTVTWINVNGVHDLEKIEKIGKIFNIHPLTQEDIVNTVQRPKMEDFDSYIYVVLKMLTYNKHTKMVESEQVSIIMGEHYVITFQEKEGDVFNIIRDRIRNAKGKIRMMKADYLMYSLIDAIIDHYFLIMEKSGEEIEMLETKVVEQPDPPTMQALQKIRRSLIFLRKSVWPLRELINGLLRSESKLISSQVEIFMKDVYDHTIQVVDTVETFRDMLSGMLDMYLSSISNKMNNIMKVLTIIATIFIPLTFITGVYGMNFTHMPELNWKYGYLYVWIIMIGVSATMLVFFKKRKWI